MPKINLSGRSDGWFNFSALLLDEFVPVVQIDTASMVTDKISAVLIKEETVELSKIIEANKRRIKLVSVITSPGEIEIPFKVGKGQSTLDKDGCLTPKLSASATKVILSPSSSTKVEFGKPFKLKVSISGHEKRQFLIDFFADDDSDDLNKGELKSIFCGRIEVCVFPDVFTNNENNQLIDEITYLQTFVEAESPDEYSGNYCMAAAERGLSKLFNNTTDFYSVDRGHNRLNNISFAGKGAKDRGAKFKSNGYVFSNIEFDDYQIDHNLRKKTKTDADWSSNCYKVVTLKSGSKLQEYLKDSIKGKAGFHVYYMSVSDDFHTLLLVIDSRDQQSITYAIYDQHGLTSSSGAFSEIEAGIARQTSWTFLNLYLNMYNKTNSTDKYGKVTTRIWKIQRKL